ncbi:conserved exported hypothetical protein [Candidatus Sulfopaludibacter sp. SbA3]|nr:conserved exported hypothetical protein [Candidatus Sulfopaludibacter sp. SbA3]
MSLRKKCLPATEIILSLTLLCSGLHAQASRVQTFPLSGAQDLDARNVKVESTEYKGRKAIRITFPDPPVPGPHFALLRGVDFADGTIEADVAAKVTMTAPPGLPPAPGFIGIAFRSRSDANHYELFYIRPGNSSSSDQLHRNHSVQYVSMPDFDWYKLRRSWPSVYEAYADLEPEAWIRMKIEVAGRQAKLYVNSAPKPVLVVDGLKGEDLTGGIGLWAAGEQDNYFSNMRITHAKPQAVENGSDATGTWDIKYGIGSFSGSLNLHRDGATVSGTASGLLGTDVPVTGTWRNGYLEIAFHGPWPAPGSDPGGVTASLAGWIDGNSAKGRVTIIGQADDGAWTATRRE